MSQHQRTPRADVIYVFIAIYVVDVRALAARDKSRRASDASKRPHRRIDASRNHALCSGEEGLGLFVIHLLALRRNAGLRDLMNMMAFSLAAATRRL